jgi:hypothetical protein
MPAIFLPADLPEIIRFLERDAIALFASMPAGTARHKSDGAARLSRRCEPNTRRQCSDRTSI